METTKVEKLFRKIAVDLDGPLANMTSALNNYYNKIFGTDFKLEDYKFHDLEKIWLCSKERAVRIVEGFYKSLDFLKLMPMSGSREGILELSKKYELFVLTARPESTRTRTEDFLRRNFGPRIKVIYTGQYKAAASDIDKGGICITEGANVLIEDCLETALSAAGKGLEVFLFDSPWNQLNGDYVSVPAGFSRITGGWKEIVERLLVKN